MKIMENNLFFAWVESEIAAGKHVKFLLKGNSMFPLLRNGKDKVILTKSSCEELEPMDVVLFRYRGGYLLHRIILVDGENLLLQGDGSFVAKEQCIKADVVGKLIQVCRPSGKIVSVENWKWRLPSRLWRCSDTLRKLMLRLAVFMRRG